MKLSAYAISALTLFGLSSCLDDLKLPGSDDTQTDTSTQTSINPNPQCTFLESNIDFTFNVHSETNLVEFDASTSMYSQCDQSYSFDSFEWNLGDGTVVESNSPIFSHAYSDNGEYSVTLTASFEDAELSTTRVVPVNNGIQHCIALASQAFFTYDSIDDQTFIFDASQSYIFEDCQYQDIQTYHWEFADGNSITTTNNMITHTFEYPSLYPVSLTISSATQSYTYDVLIGAGIAHECLDTAYIRTSQSSNVVEFDVMFGPAECEELPIEYIWRTGDDSFDYFGKNISHTYPNGGLYEVELEMNYLSQHAVINEIVSVNYQNTQTCTENGFIPSFEVINFSSNNVYLNAQYDSVYEDCTYQPIIDFIWDMGDGTIYSGAGNEVDHTYEYAGTYAVNLTVITPNNIYNYVQILDIHDDNHCVVDYSIQSYVHELTATFDASESFSCNTQYSEEIYIWDFGDGTTEVTQSPFVSHEYEGNGNYLVTVTNSDYNLALSEVNIEYYMYCTADDPVSFCSSPAPILTIETISYDSYSGHVQFGLTDDSYQSDDNTYEWKTSDGESFSGDTFSTNFASPGIHTVFLKAIRPNYDDLATTIQFEVDSTYCVGPLTYTQTGTAIETDTWTSTDYDISIAPELDPIYIPEPLSVNNIEIVTLSMQGNTVTYEILWEDVPCKTFLWDFGDGNYLETTSYIVTHEYDQAGSYNVSVNDGFNNGQIDINIVQDICFESSDVDFIILPSIGLTVNLEVAPSTSCSLEEVYEWELGDGRYDLSISPAHSITYEQPGTYYVTLTILSTGATVTKQVDVFENPFESIDLTYDYTVIEDIVIFEAQANLMDNYFYEPRNLELETSEDYPVAVAPPIDLIAPPFEEFSYTWDFGDENASIGQFISHTYESDGTYSVTLRATHNETGLYKEISFLVLVNFEPEYIELTPL